MGDADLLRKDYARVEKEDASVRLLDLRACRDDESGSETPFDDEDDLLQYNLLLGDFMILFGSLVIIGSLNVIAKAIKYFFSYDLFDIILVLALAAQCLRVWLVSFYEDIE
jgi:hypothetical protein